MKNQLSVRYALACLQELESRPSERFSASELSHCQGVPYADCLDVVRHLEAAGIIESDRDGKAKLLKPLAELTPLDILTALWTDLPDQPKFKMLFQADSRLSTRKALEAVAWARNSEVYVSDGLSVRE